MPPVIPQQTSQRSLLDHIGEGKPGQKTIKLITNIGNVNQHRSYREAIAAPSLRTKWGITIVTFTFRGELERGIFPIGEIEENFKIPEWELPLEVKLLAGGNPVVVNYFNIFKQKPEEQKEIGTVKLPEIVKKILVLELFAPITLVNSQQLEIELRLEDKSQPKVNSNNELRYFLQMNEPELDIIFDQTFPA